jgi:hypothetical protein
MNVIAINTGSGPVNGATVENADRNIAVFVRDLADDASGSGCRVVIKHTARQSEDDDGSGRWPYKLYVDDERVLEVDMPGLPLERVRYLKEPGQNIWDFPRLYVDGSSWIWLFALGVCRPDEDDE